MTAFSFDDLAFMASQRWTPESISTALWLDASDAGTITTVSSAVSQWDDKSGNGRHATQSEATRRPVVSAQALNGRDVVVFDGSNDQMLTPATYLRNLTTFEIFVVISKGSGGTDYGPTIALTDNNASADKGAFHYIKSNNTAASYPNYNAWGYYDNVGTYTNGQWQIIDFLAQGTSWKVNKNATQEGTSAMSPGVGIVSTLASLSLASQNPAFQRYGNFSYGELIVTINTGASNVERIQGYLAHKWGLAANLPSDHPYKTSAP